MVYYSVLLLYQLPLLLAKLLYTAGYLRASLRIFDMQASSIRGTV